MEWLHQFTVTEVTISYSKLHGDGSMAAVCD